MEIIRASGDHHQLAGLLYELSYDRNPKKDTQKNDHNAMPAAAEF
jgi:hypothetical protein